MFSLREKKVGAARMMEHASDTELLSCIEQLTLEAEREGERNRTLAKERDELVVSIHQLEKRYTEIKSALEEHKSLIIVSEQHLISENQLSLLIYYETCLEQVCFGESVDRENNRRYFSDKICELFGIAGESKSDIGELEFNNKVNQKKEETAAMKKAFLKRAKGIQDNFEAYARELKQLNRDITNLDGICRHLKETENSSLQDAQETGEKKEDSSDVMLSADIAEGNEETEAAIQNASLAANTAEQAVQRVEESHSGRLRNQIPNVIAQIYNEASVLLPWHGQEEMQRLQNELRRQQNEIQRQNESCEQLRIRCEESKSRQEASQGCLEELRTSLETRIRVSLMEQTVQGVEEPDLALLRVQMHELVTHIEKYKRANTHLQIHKEELRERSALASKALGKIQKTQQKIEKESCALQEVLGEQESTFDDFVGEACKTYYDKELHVDLNARLRLIVELNSQIIALELERKKLFFLSRAISDCLKNCDALQILVERIKTNGGLSFLSHKERIYALVEELEELKNKFEVLNNNIHQLLNYKEYCQTDYTLKSVTNFMTPKFMKLEDYKAAIKGKGKSLIQSGITHTEKAIHQIMGPMTVTAVMESDIEMLRECSENTKTNAKGTGLHF